LNHVIVGNGIAGVSAALRLRELDPEAEITIISGESTYHWSRPALMYVFQGHMRYQDTKPYPDGFWERERINLVRDWVVGIDWRERQLSRHRGEPLAYDRLLIATGSQSNRFGWPGQDLDGVQGLYSLMDLRALHENVQHARRAVIVGGGLIGVELAEMLHSVGLHVTFLVREGSYWNNVLPGGESAMVTRLLRARGVDLRLETELASIEDDGQGRVGAVVTGGGERIECQLVGLTAGVRPNVDLARESGVPVGRGVLVDDRLRTQVEHVFAAGDCAEIQRAGEQRNLLQQVWYTGEAQGRAVAENMAGGDRPYEPAPWFNSAKFFDLEYQTYGQVPASSGDGDSLWWEDAGGERAIRLVHTGGVLTGVNVLGLRWRQEVCEAWISAGLTLEQVIERMGDAGFDPEFTHRREPEAARALRAQLAEAGL
jgi:NADPH-dependent 2,4-dienoyl-CoA reductase/sulfur reductase-like enzyme